MTGPPKFIQLAFSSCSEEVAKFTRTLLNLDPTTYYSKSANNHTGTSDHAGFLETAFPILMRLDQILKREDQTDSLSNNQTSGPCPTLIKNRSKYPKYAQYFILILKLLE